MAVQATQITVPSNGSTVSVLTATPINQGQISIRNTGTVTVLLGGPDGILLFPLQASEYLGLTVSTDDTIQVKVQTNGTAGQLTVLTA